MVDKSKFFFLQLPKFFPCLLYKVEQEYYIKVNFQLVKKLLIFMRYFTYTLYQQLLDLYGIDYIERLNRFEISYNLLSLQLNSRVTLTTTLSEGQAISSICSIFSNALWYEREVYDMFGILFLDSKDLRRILTDYGFKGHPMRKDFPLTGFIEIRYNDFGKRLKYESLNIFN